MSVATPFQPTPATAQATAPSRTRQAWSVLAVSTLAFTVCFMVWMMFGVIGRGDRLHLRHVLFAVTPGVDVVALRRRAEALRVELRCAPLGGDAFAAAAREWSNCPSGSTGNGGGDLGWLTRDAVAPEFAREVFDSSPGLGVMPRLVHSRHGLHIVEVLARESAAVPSFESVRSAVAQSLRQQAWINALRRYLLALTGRAQLEGVTLDAAAAPFVP